MAPLKFVQGDAFEIGGGKVTVVEFWATWCPPCKVAIPHLNKLYVNKYKARGVQLVGVTKEDEGTVKPFIAERKAQFTYPVAIDGTGASTTLCFPLCTLPSANYRNRDWKPTPQC